MEQPLRDERTLRAVCAHLGSEGSAFLLDAYQSVSSTNALLRSEAEAGAPEGRVLIASTQSAGRGRRGRSFYSPPGTGLYMSLLLRPAGDAWHGARITTLAAVAVCEAIEAETGAKPGVKWVNDILLGGKKVCGILAEAATDGANAARPLRYAILGIGVNVCPPAEGFPAEISDVAGCVLPAFDPEMRCRLAADILLRFMRRYRAGQPALDMDAYRRRLVGLGSQIRVLLPGGPLLATALDVDAEGRLLVRYADGSEAALSSGEISIRL